MNVTVVTLAVGYDPWIMDMLRTNRYKWCSSQNLNYKFYDRPLLPVDDWPYSWHKLPAMLFDLNAGRNVLWIDADAIIVNKLPLGDLKDNIACAADHNGWNLGIWYVPSTCAGVLETMFDMGKFNEAIRHNPWWEQKAFHMLYDQGKLPPVDKLDAGIWNSMNGTAIRHWPGKGARRWKLMLDAASTQLNAVDDL